MRAGNDKPGIDKKSRTDSSALPVKHTRNGCQKWIFFKFPNQLDMIIDFTGTFRNDEVAYFPRNLYAEGNFGFPGRDIEIFKGIDE
jgi:hypothetical protein